MDLVGLILGLQISRLARACKDWHRLFEPRAKFRTLLANAAASTIPSTTTTGSCSA